MPPRPTVTLTFAQSLDGRIATVSGDSRWISGEETLTLAHEIRSANDAILVGIGTVLRDDPELTCRLPDCPSPLRVVLDSALRLPLTSRIVRTSRAHRTAVYTADAGSPAAHALTERGVTVRGAVTSEGGGLELQQVLEDLAADGVRSVMVEGGAAILTSFLRKRLVDRMVVVSAPVVIGTGTQAVGELGVVRLCDAWRGRTLSVRRLGEDVVWEVAFGDS